jgi:REP element-mobilizing transposase RayT
VERADTLHPGSMHPYTTKAATVKWYHVIWATYRRRRVFKIPALRRFCEQLIQVNCVRADWIVERACIEPDRMRLLVKASATLPRGTLTLQLKESAARVMHEAGAIESSRNIWDEGCWCLSVSSAPGVDAVKRHLERSSAIGPLRDHRRETLLRQVAEPRWRRS